MDSIERIVERDYPFKGRGLRSLDERVGGITMEIGRLLNRKYQLRVLEIGCGFGTALLELREKFGRSLSLTGISKTQADGSAALLSANATRLGIPHADIMDISVVNGDVNDLYSLVEGKFDLVFSQVSWMYFDDKLEAMLDTVRILGPGGIAKIEFEFHPIQNAGSSFENLIEINMVHERMDVRHFFSQFSGIKYICRGRNAALQIDRDHVDLRHLGNAWTFIKSVSSKQALDTYVGVKSYYTLGRVCRRNLGWPS